MVIREIKNPVYGKRQIQVNNREREILLTDKPDMKVIFPITYNEYLKQGELGHVVQIHVCRKLDLKSLY